MKTWIPDSRNFAYLNWKQVDALPRESTLLVLPTAAIEQHGHHLPLATDTLINNLLLGKALERLPKEISYSEAGISVRDTKDCDLVCESPQRLEVDSLDNGQALKETAQAIQGQFDRAQSDPFASAENA